jgi:hypothetical protein
VFVVVECDVVEKFLVDVCVACDKMGIRPSPLGWVILNCERRSSRS